MINLYDYITIPAWATPISWSEITTSVCTPGLCTIVTYESQGGIIVVNNILNDVQIDLTSVNNQCYSFQLTYLDTNTNCTATTSVTFEANAPVVSIESNLNSSNTVDICIYGKYCNESLLNANDTITLNLYNNTTLVATTTFRVGGNFKNTLDHTNSTGWFNAVNDFIDPGSIPSSGYLISNTGLCFQFDQAAYSQSTGFYNLSLDVIANSFCTGLSSCVTKSVLPIIPSLDILGTFAWGDSILLGSGLPGAPTGPPFPNPGEESSVWSYLMGGNVFDTCNNITANFIDLATNTPCIKSINAFTFEAFPCLSKTRGVTFVNFQKDFNLILSKKPSWYSSNNVLLEEETTMAYADLNGISEFAGTVAHTIGSLTINQIDFVVAHLHVLPPYPNYPGVSAYVPNWSRGDIKIELSAEPYKATNVTALDNWNPPYLTYMFPGDDGIGGSATTTCPVQYNFSEEGFYKFYIRSKWTYIPTNTTYEFYNQGYILNNYHL